MFCLRVGRHGKVFDNLLSKIPSSYNTQIIQLKNNPLIPENPPTVEDFYIHSYSSSENTPVEGSWASLWPSAWQDLNLTLRPADCLCIPLKDYPIMFTVWKNHLNFRGESVCFSLVYSCLEHSLTGPSIQLPMCPKEQHPCSRVIPASFLVSRPLAPDGDSWGIQLSRVKTTVVGIDRLDYIV